MADMTPEQKAAAEKAAADAAAAADSGDNAEDDDADLGTPKPEDEKDPEKVRLRVALAKANKEAGDRRKRLKELEEAEEERKKASMSASEKLQAENEKLKKEAQEANENAKTTLIRAAFAVAAAQSGAVHPEDVFLLADNSGVEVADDGTVTGVAEAVEALVKAGRVPVSEERRTAPDLNGGAGSGDRSKGAKLTPDELEMARKMGVSPERAAIQKAALAKEQAV